uniref:Uncharacterized protein n=1 Tax=Romanomermis culicivorax TaxID=13658 RepID=A0A915KSH1_ROMCU
MEHAFLERFANWNKTNKLSSVVTVGPSGLFCMVQKSIQLLQFSVGRTVASRQAKKFVIRVVGSDVL